MKQVIPPEITGMAGAPAASVVDHKFGSSDPFTLGVEEEYMLLDPESLDLVQHIETVLDAVEGDELADRINAELMQSVLEIATPVCRTAGDVMRELRLGLDLNFPGRIEQLGDDAGGCRARLAEYLAVRPRDLVPVLPLGDVDVRPDDVLEAGTRPLERLGDDPQAEGGLLVRALRDRCPVGRDRRRPGHVHPVSDDDRAREPRDALVRRVAGDELPLQGGT